MDNIKKFLANQKVLTIATAKDNQPWTSNVYFAYDDELNFYWVSSLDRRHSIEIKENEKVAFNTVWHNPDDLGDRKAIQGTGTAKLVTNWVDVAKMLIHMSKRYPDWGDALDSKAMRAKIGSSRLYIIKPDFIKYWDDELYGEDEKIEVSFNK